MQKRLLGILLIAILSLPCVAQKISIRQFKRVKFDFAKKKMYPVDKKMATLDLKTDEKGFTFKADGKTEIAAQEGDGQITLLAPHKTAFILVKHPVLCRQTSLGKNINCRSNGWCSRLFLRMPFCK